MNEDPNCDVNPDADGKVAEAEEAETARGLEAGTHQLDLGREDKRLLRDCSGVFTYCCFMLTLINQRQKCHFSA